MDAVKYPHITADLSDDDGNAFVVIGKVAKAMRRAGVSDKEIDAFRKEATSGDYDHLLNTCMAWVNVE